MDKTRRTQYQIQGFLKTPPLWNGEAFYGIQGFKIPDTIPFPSYIQDRLISELNTTHVLGKRAEIFFEHAIISSGEYEVFASRLQILREKITIGEIDFLLKEKSTDKHKHVELVYKFYIYDPSFPEEMKKWIGPNRKDSLLQKIEKLNNHQLPLIHRDETKASLKDLGIDIEKTQQEVFFPANLFVPKQFSGVKLPYINNNCIVGFWIHRKDFTKRNYPGCIFFSPKKQDWPILPNLNNIWFSYEEIIKQVDQLLKIKKAPLLWMKSAGGNFERFFVVWW